MSHVNLRRLCQVPAVAYGGPDVPHDQPSSESEKIAESLVLIQFFADLAAESDLLPQDALGKAKVRFFLDTVSNKIQPGLNKWGLGTGTYDAFFKALDAIQDQLPPVGKGKYIFGDELTLVDIAVAPFLGRSVLIQLKYGFEKFDGEEAKRGWELFQGPNTRGFAGIPMVLPQGRAGNLTRFVVKSKVVVVLDWCPGVELYCCG